MGKFVDEKIEIRKIKIAKKRIKKMKGFYIHLTCFVLVCSGVTFINFQTTPDNLWFYWLPMGWIIGVVLHGINVFKLKEWEARKLAELLKDD